MHACAMPATTSSTPAPPHAHSLCVRTPLPEAILVSTFPVRFCSSSGLTPPDRQAMLSPPPPP
ncbi:hypothetical protein HETIRDRAFT_165558 [Heterobasidion irregulare TC 32-1]|uniref:Uncharacterized protein n=1 Tax=Heterobasidion irregulare (strain TC 32-1) TaxID=747525 RepID=W4KLF2_HETIT|nr:uncharacterized protein HETIRDRAFT_165558 [Heterobasidion irregulare TC 32-1]ETW86683.1 hypothetical protein HETIRDRAFT_165558 [Heterobasidion irregulare TC 32-1]